MKQCSAPSLFVVQNADKQVNLESQEEIDDPHSIVMNAKVDKNNADKSSTLTLYVRFSIRYFCLFSILNIAQKESPPPPPYIHQNTF